MTKAIIPAGQSCSQIMDLGNRRLRSINMPSAWDEATLSFLVSNDGENFRVLYIEGLVYDTNAQSYGNPEYRIGVTRDVSLVFENDRFRSFRYLILQSGLTSAPIAQTADRSIELICW